MTKKKWILKNDGNHRIYFYYFCIENDGDNCSRISICCVHGEDTLKRKLCSTTVWWFSLAWYMSVFNCNQIKMCSQWKQSNGRFWRYVHAHFFPVPLFDVINIERIMQTARSNRNLRFVQFTTSRSVASRVLTHSLAHSALSNMYVWRISVAVCVMWMLIIYLLVAFYSTKF